MRSGRTAWVGAGVGLGLMLGDPPGKGQWSGSL